MFSWESLKKHQNPLTTIYKSIIINVIILGSGSVWWFLTESDGISQGIGIIIYLGSIIIISLINIISIYFKLKIEKKSFQKHT